MLCINRDENALNNMIKIVNHYLDKKDRLLKYKRYYDLEKKSNIIIRNYKIYILLVTSKINKNLFYNFKGDI
jgi:hypothetical protein